MVLITAEGGAVPVVVISWDASENVVDLMPFLTESVDSWILDKACDLVGAGHQEDREYTRQGRERGGDISHTGFARQWDAVRGLVRLKHLGVVSQRVHGLRVCVIEGCG